MQHEVHPDAPRRVHWNAQVRAELRAAMTGALPHEGCGVLGGRRRDGVLELASFVALPNSARSADRFCVRPADFTAALLRLASERVDFLGFAHSHPNGVPRPSPTDVRELWHHCAHLIAAPSVCSAALGQEWTFAAFWGAGRERGFLALALADPGAAGTLPPR